MESQPRRLWRKIGLQKNFLQGTSHSDESKNSLLEQSFANSETSSQSQTKNKSFIKTKTPFQQVQISNNNLKVNVKAKKSLNVSLQSCETPINKLLGQYEAESKYTLWQQSDQDFAYNKTHSDMNAGMNARKNSSGVSIVLSNSTINQNNMSVMIQNIGKQNNRNKSSQKEIFKVEDSVVMSEQRFGQVKELEYKSHTIGGGNKEEAIRIRLMGVKAIDEGRQYVERGEGIQVRQMKELIGKKYMRIQSLQCRLNTLLTQTLPTLSQKSSQLTNQHQLFKQSITQSLTLLHKQLSLLIEKQFHEHICQLSDEIGYLYSQNQQLIDKIQGKENMIKRLVQQNGLVRKKLEEIDQVGRLQIQEGKQMIIKLHNKIYSLEQKLQDLQDLESQKQSLTKTIASLQAEILLINNHSKQQQLRLNQQINSITQELSAKQHKIQQLQLKLSETKSQASSRQQQLQLQISKLSELNRSLQQQLVKVKIQNQSAQQIDYLKRQLQKQRKQILAIKQLQKEQVFMRELLQTLLGQSLSQNSIQIVNKIQKQYSIKSYDFLNTMFAFIKEEIYHNTNTNPNNNNGRNNNNINNNQNNNNNNNHQNINNNNSNNTPLNLRIQGFGANNDSSKNLLRKTGYFGQVAGSRKLLNVRLDDIQKNYSTEILEQSQNGIEDQQHVRFQQLQIDNNMSPKQKNQLTFSHMRHESVQHKRLHTNPSNPNALTHALTQRYSSSKDINQDLQIVKSGLRLQGVGIFNNKSDSIYYMQSKNHMIGGDYNNNNHHGRNSQLIEQQHNNYNQNNNNKQYVGTTFSNPDYSFSEQNNINQLSFYKKEFDFGDQSFMNDQDQYKRQSIMGSFTDRNKSSSSNTLMLNQHKRNSIIINNQNSNRNIHNMFGRQTTSNIASPTLASSKVKHLRQQQQDRSRNITSYKNQQQQSLPCYYDRKSIIADRNNVDGTTKTQRDDIIEKIRQRVRQKFSDSRSRSKSKSKSKQQHQQTPANHYNPNQQPNFNLNFTNINNKQSIYNNNKSNRHQTCMISMNEPSYNNSAMTTYPKTSRPSLYTHHDNDKGSRLLLGVGRKDENLYTNGIGDNNLSNKGETNTKSNTNVLTDFFDRHKHTTVGQQYQSMKTQEQRITSPSNRLTVRSPTNLKPRSPSNSSTITGKVNNNKYPLTGVGYGLMSNANKSVAVGSTVRSGFSRSTIEKPQLIGYTRKTPQASTLHQNITTYQPKSPSYSITNRQHASSFTKKY